MRGDGFGAGRHGRGAGRFDRGHDSNVWKRRKDVGQSSTTRASGSGDTGFDKWDAAAGAGDAVHLRADRWGPGGAGGGDGSGMTAQRHPGKTPTLP